MVRLWLMGTLCIVFSLITLPVQASAPPLMTRLDTLGDVARWCDQGSQVMCPIVSNNLSLIPPATRQSVRAKAQEACDQKAADGCWQLGVDMIVEAAALPGGEKAASARGRELEKASRLFHDACQSGSAEACRQMILDDGWISGRVPDKSKLIARMKQLCDNNLASACFSLGQALHAPLFHFPLDPVQGREALVRGCNLGDGRACDLVARVLEAHEMEWSGPAAFPELFTIACDRGSDAACSALGERYAQNPALPQASMHAAKAWEVGCLLANGVACTHFAQILLDGATLPADPVQARQLFIAACFPGPETACFSATSLLMAGTPSVNELVQAHNMLLVGCSKNPDPECARITEVEKRLVAAHQEISARQPVLVRRVWPTYPKDAVQKRGKFMSQVQFTVAPDGSVKGCSADGGGAEIDRAVCAAVVQFQYAPAIDGNGREQNAVIHMAFGG